jgi:hypothetical protein
MHFILRASVKKFPEFDDIGGLKLKLIYDRKSLTSGEFDQTFVFCLTIAGFLMWGTLSDERTGL